MNACLATLNDTDLAAMEADVRTERRERERITEELHHPYPPLAVIEEALYRATDWLEPAYISYDWAGKLTAQMGTPREGKGYYGVAYPDGRVILCHAATLTKKTAAILAGLRAKWEPEGYRIARQCLMDDLDDYLWRHGTRIGRRQARWETTPSGYPWPRDKGLVAHRIWARYPQTSPATRRAFFFSTREGAYCPWDPKEWPYGRWNKVLLASEVPPPMPKAKRKRVRR